jgi:hypothetical protein
MAKSQKRIFQIPTIPQVSAFMSYVMPEWPKSFCDWYADKFWHNYQATGWKLSNNVAMKDWQSAFHSRWKSLSYEESRNKLQACLKLETTKPKQTDLFPNGTFSGHMMINGVDVTTQEGIFKAKCDTLDKILAAYRSGSIDRHLMASQYRWIRECKLLQFTQDEINKLVADSANDKEYGRYLSVKLLFSKLISQNKTFTQYANETINFSGISK